MIGPRALAGFVVDISPRPDRGCRRQACPPRASRDETASRLRRDAIAIWQAGVAAVDSERLVRDRVHFANAARSRRPCLRVGPDQPDRRGRRGQGGGRHGRRTRACPGRNAAADRLTGWVNVPADCVRPLAAHSPASRPAGRAQRTDRSRGRRIANHFATRQPAFARRRGDRAALRRWQRPVTGSGQRISLADKQDVTRHLMVGGATINELNCVRKQLSEIKGGNLARAASGARLIALDHLRCDRRSARRDRLGPDGRRSHNSRRCAGRSDEIRSRSKPIPEAVWSVLEAKSRARRAAVTRQTFTTS